MATSPGWQDWEGLGPAFWGGCRNLGSIRREDRSGLPTGRGVTRGGRGGVFLDSTGQKPIYPSEWVALWACLIALTRFRLAHCFVSLSSSR